MTYEELIKQAETFYDAHKDSQAITYATRAIESDPTRVDGYYWRGLAFRRAGAFEEMQEDAETLLDCTPSTTTHNAYRGWAYNMKQEYKKAIDECTKALEEDDSVKEAYLYRAWAYDELKHVNSENLSKAIEDCNKVIGFDWKYKKNAYNILGVALQNSGDLDQAIETYNQAIAIDPEYVLARNNRLRTYHAKDGKLAMPLVEIRNNADHMDDLKANIERVVPFLGAGASKPYGYYTWRTLLMEILEECCLQYGFDRTTDKMKQEKMKQIREYIEDDRYMLAIDEMEQQFSTISYAVQTVIERTARFNPVTVENMRSILSEYLHLFPSQTFLTTNYDTVVEDILRNQGLEVGRYLPTSGFGKGFEKFKRQFRLPEFQRKYWSEDDNTDSSKAKKSIVYYLHGIHKAPLSIVLSRVHYDEYYGSDGDIKSNLRRFLPSQIYSIYHNSVFLYIGCGMMVTQDRILKVLREFCGSLPTPPTNDWDNDRDNGNDSDNDRDRNWDRDRDRDIGRGYALLNVNDFAKTKEPWENWNTLGRVYTNLDTFLRNHYTP